MVLDCRPSNACHQEPPFSALATPGSLGGINLADSWLADDGERTDPHAASIDLADGYYQFLVPEVASWFGLGLRRTAGEIGVTQVFDEDVGAYVAVEPSDWLWACFAGLPMGWSWGLYFCHEALSQCCRRALRSGTRG